MTMTLCPTVRCCCHAVVLRQDCTWNFPEMRPSVGEMLLELDVARDNAFKGVASTLYLHEGVKIMLCSAVMNRWHNACTAILYNCCVLWEFRFQVSLNVVGFGEDNDALSWLSFYARPAIAYGLLFLASGGSAGARALAAGIRGGPYEQELQSVQPEGPQGEALPPYLVAGDGCPQPLRTWHASLAKNTSHEVACYCADNIWRWTEDMPQIICNLDGDNFVTRAFPQAVARVFAQRDYDMSCCIQASSACCVGTTGRLCYMRVTFEQLGGYDATGTEPMGYQDIDLRDRVRTFTAWATSSTAHVSCPQGGFPKSRTATLGVTEIGGALPNDTRVREHDRGSQKVLHTGVPVANRGVWGKMNRANANLMKERLANGEVVRNDGTLLVAAWVLLPEKFYWNNQPFSSPSEDFTWTPGRREKIAYAWDVSPRSGEALPPPAADTPTAAKRLRFAEETAVPAPEMLLVSAPARRVSQPGTAAAASAAGSSGGQRPPPILQAKAKRAPAPGQGVLPPLVQETARRTLELVERPQAPNVKVVHLFVLGLNNAHRVRATANTRAPQCANRKHETQKRRGCWRAHRHILEHTFGAPGRPWCRTRASAPTSGPLCCRLHLPI